MLESNPCCSLGKMSRKLRISRRTIQNIVKAITGKRFRDLREELLLVRIKNLLASAPNTTVMEISLEAGYRSPRSFARAVKRACGISPQQLRNRIAGEQITRLTKTLILGSVQFKN